MSNFSTGHDAEARAAEHLKSLGFKIVEINWKTRYCEVDIIAMRKKMIYFVEVKYRSNSYQGRGIDYITPMKLNQMKFAAQMWVAEHDWRGQYFLSALGMDGLSYEFIESIF